MNRRYKRRAKFLFFSPLVVFLFFVLAVNVRAGNYQRIVSLSPGITETLYALDLGDKIVGVTQYCDWPPEARDLPKVAGFREINLEAVIRAQPDVALLPDDMAHFRASLEEVGVPVILVDNRTLAGYTRDVAKLGRLMGKTQEAEKLVREFQNAATKNSDAGFKPKILFALLNGDECERPVAEITVLGAEGFYEDLLVAAGGKNAYEGKVPYPRLSGEAIFAMRPDIVALAAMECPNPEVTLAHWRKLPGFAGAQTRFLLLTDKGDTIPGPRSPRTLEKLAEAVRADIAAKRESTNGANN